MKAAERTLHQTLEKWDFLICIDELFYIGLCRIATFWGKFLTSSPTFRNVTLKSLKVDTKLYKVFND